LKRDQYDNFTAKFAYEILHKNTVGGIKFFKTICKVKAIPSVIHFVWRMRVNGVSTRDNLRHKSIPISNVYYVMCGIVEESVNHLFFDCKVACIT